MYGQRREWIEGNLNAHNTQHNASMFFPSLNQTSKSSKNYGHILDCADDAQKNIFLFFFHEILGRTLKFSYLFNHPIRLVLDYPESWKIDLHLPLHEVVFPHMRYSLALQPTSVESEAFQRRINKLINSRLIVPFSILNPNPLTTQKTELEKEINISPAYDDLTHRDAKFSPKATKEPEIAKPHKRKSHIQNPGLSNRHKFQ